MIERRSIRRAQAIHPYGPGAILDWGQECFVVLDTSARTSGWSKAPRIELPRLQHVLGATDGFRLPPTIASDSFRQTSALRVQRFPSWLFCPKCRYMSRWGRKEEVASEGGLPRCSSDSCRDKNVILVPMRYVAACPGGHLTDIDWHRWAHSGGNGRSTSCDRRTAKLYFRANAGKGATLEALVVNCTSCKSERNLKELLASEALRRAGQHCYGRQPWESRDDERGCDLPLKVLQRSQTAVHFPSIESALDIRLAIEVEDPRVRAIQRTIREFSNLELSADELRSFADRIARKATEHLHSDSPTESEITSEDIEEWLRNSEKMSHASSSAPDADSGQSRSTKLLLEEWPILTTTSPNRNRDAPILVREERLDAETEASELRDFIDGAFLVDRLREVRVFEGFHRVNTDGDTVFPNLGRTRPKWLPAIEVFGEGLFLRFSQTALEKWERAQNRRLKKRTASIAKSLSGEDPFLKRFESRIGVLSRFILVHTFSHILMRQLCYECGYSGASLRERLYVFDDRAGVLIFTADGDSEGSLGGLVRQGRADRLQGTVLSALERASWCSNDPICSEMPTHGPGKSNRAACHACTLVSETSCTELNALLDREFVIGDGQTDSSVLGFFKPLLTRLHSEES